MINTSNHSPVLSLSLFLHVLDTGNNLPWRVWKGATQLALRCTHSQSATLKYTGACFFAATRFQLDIFASHLSQFYLLPFPTHPPGQDRSKDALGTDVTELRYHLNCHCVNDSTFPSLFSVIKHNSIVLFIHFPLALFSSFLTDRGYGQVTEPQAQLRTPFEIRMVISTNFNFSASVKKSGQILIAIRIGK